MTPGMDALPNAELLDRLAVTIQGSGAKSMMFAHGFGCDQAMWRYVAPAFEQDFRVVLFDYVGASRSDLNAYDPVKYASLDGYADDVVELGRALGVRGGTFVGHSISGMIGVLAAKRAPGLFEKLILVCPSPRYIDDRDYIGGFTGRQIDELLEFLDSNHMGWSQAMAPVIMGNADQPELGDELTNSFCRPVSAVAVPHQPSRNPRIVHPARCGSRPRRSMRRTARYRCPHSRTPASKNGARQRPAPETQPLPNIGRGHPSTKR